MRRARIVVTIWILLILLAGLAMAFTLAGVIDIELTRSELIEFAISAPISIVAGWLLWQGRRYGFLLMLALVAYNMAAAVFGFLFLPDVTLAEVGVTVLIVSAFGFQLNHSTVRTFCGFTPHDSPKQAVLGFVNRMIMYVAGTTLMAEIFLGWQIGVVVLIALLSRELFRLKRAVRL